ncbi:hypothetical protein K353_06102 [Kitasatospora sp. SolWspMP-SS2h]|uniref:hypothetical protein n=1 Tax=Kitasatospora sp. SolWspMP-SS2h TaxID=1305729 RepID=UPI000DBA6102|nr:hypothetical protein [Kitasatospora sp. SolWspMP-SS2h]RAJ31751.1 hypothetical protein K353_06102 [Kitasatospora sp. SolWspMP-SS2h]
MSDWLVYESGEWTALPKDPVPDDGSGDWYAMLKKAGFERWTSSCLRAGEWTGEELLLEMTVYHRYGTIPHFAIDLYGNEDTSILTAYAAELPDVMDLIARWAPAVQALAAAAHGPRPRNGQG